MSERESKESTTRIFVITNANGEVVGSSHMPASQSSADALSAGRQTAVEGQPSPGRPVPIEGQRVHEVYLPADFRESESAVELHKYLEKLVRA